MAKKKYRVYYDVSTTYTIDVEADSEQEAGNIANDADASLFDKSNDSDWDLYMIHEIDENGHEKEE